MGLVLPTRVPIRVRTAAALSIPLVLLLVVAGLEVAQSGRAMADVREQSELATASIGPAGAVNALMAERNYTSLWLFGVEESVDLQVDSLDEARARTDASLAAFEDEVRRRGGLAERIYGPAIEALDVLGDNRAAVDAYDGERNPGVENESGDRVWSTYSRLVSMLAHANTELAHEVEDQHLRHGVKLVDMASRQVDRISKIVRLATIEAVHVGGGPVTDRTDFRRIASRMSEADRHHLAILDLTTGPYAELREPLRQESDATGFAGIVDQFAQSGEVDIAGLLRGVSIDEDESYYGFIHEVSGIMRTRADHLDAAARADQRRVVVLSVLLVVAAAAAALVVARSITAPLRSLTRQARDMAERRLPEAVREVHELPLGQDVVVPELEPVAVASRDEVGDVADQLNAAQAAALDLAVEQAVLRRNFADVFVNVCRRIQDLLGRQLDVIAEVTSDGASPDRRQTRDGPGLSEVSRYAIRLRRHAESLLVLAGVDPRPTPTDPAPLADVVQAALGEAAGAERVRVIGVEPVMLAGPVVGDLTHLLAELVESALRLVYPEETVDIEGVAGDDGYTLRIVDRGAGLVEDDVDSVNRRLAGQEADTIAPSKYLAQYVAAKLASRHGISVTVRGTMIAGVTATVRLPPDLLAHVPHPAPQAPPTATSPAAASPEPTPDAAAHPETTPHPEPATASPEAAPHATVGAAASPGASPGAAPHAGAASGANAEPTADAEPAASPEVAAHDRVGAAQHGGTDAHAVDADSLDAAPHAAAGPDVDAGESGSGAVDVEPDARLDSDADVEPGADGGEARPGAVDAESDADGNAVEHGAGVEADADAVEPAADGSDAAAEGETAAEPDADDIAADAAEVIGADAAGDAPAAEGEADVSTGGDVAPEAAERNAGVGADVAAAAAEPVGADAAGVENVDADAPAGAGEVAGVEVEGGADGSDVDVEAAVAGDAGADAVAREVAGVEVEGGVGVAEVDVGADGVDGEVVAGAGEGGGVEVEGRADGSDVDVEAAVVADTAAQAVDVGADAARVVDARGEAADVDAGPASSSGAGGGARAGAEAPGVDDEADLDAEAAALADTIGDDPHPSGPNQVVPSGDDVDVYTLLSDFPEGVERPALATPSVRRRAGARDDAPDGE